MSGSARRKDTPGLHDRASFSIRYRSEHIGTIRFSSGPDGYRGTATICIGGATTRRTLRVDCDKPGRWHTVTARSSFGQVRMTREDTRLDVTFDGQRTSMRIPRDVVLQDGYAPALISDLIRACRARGRRRFPVCALPGSCGTVLIRRRRRFTCPIDGRRRARIDQFSYERAGSFAWVWADVRGRVLMVSAPAHETAFVRSGCSYLYRRLVLAPASLDGLHRVSIRDVRVRMRDGARLATTLYLPAGAGKYAGILIRTPYGRPLEDLEARFFCRHGFAVAVQHVRGRFGSGGEWHPFVHEGKDGYDTIEWLAKQPWCTGRIGMTGGSYSGWVQWWAAAERPPHLVTIVPGASPSDPFDGGIPYEGGVFCTTTSLGFLDVTARNATVDVSGAAMIAVASRNWSKAVRSLPVIDLDKTVLGRRDRIWRTWIRHLSKDRYWRQVSFLDCLRTMSIPVFHNAGAFDALTTSTILNYRRMRANGHGHQKLVIGPWPHFGETRTFGGRDFGAGAVFDLSRATVRWFDFWLKGRDNGIGEEPPVAVFVTGINRWRHAWQYPLAETALQKWYLRAGPRKSRGARGLLSRREPGPGDMSSTFVYDPADPTPDGEPLGQLRQTRIRRTSSGEARASSPERTDRLSVLHGAVEAKVDPYRSRLVASVGVIVRQGH